MWWDDVDDQHDTRIVRLADLLASWRSPDECESYSHRSGTSNLMNYPTVETVQVRRQAWTCTMGVSAGCVL